MKDKSIENNMLKGASIIIVIGIFAKLASFISEAILASCLGTTYQADAYYMVSNIQQVIYPMLSVSIWKIFLPIYKEKIAKEQYNEAFMFSNKIITMFFIISLFITICIYFFSDKVVSIIAPGFALETKELCIFLVRMSSPAYIFITIAAIYSAMLQCHNKFLGSQIREVITHIPVIIASLIFFKKYGVGVLAVAIVVGGLCRFIVELPFVDWGYKYKIDFRFRDGDIKSLFKRVPSVLISESINQINILIDKMMASSLPTGAISSLNYGNRLTNVLSGLFSTAISTALYPQVVELVALGKRNKVSELMTKIINIFVLILVPITFACIFFASSFVSIVFERGAFGTIARELTAGVFACYAIGIFFIACNTVLTNVYYGCGDTKTPMLISIINLLSNVVGNYIFILVFGVKGLALSTSISAFIAFIARIVLIKKYVTLNIKKIFVNFVKLLFISLVACGIPKLLFIIYDVCVYVELLLASLFGIIIFLVLTRILNIKEMFDLKQMIKRKISKLK